MDYKRSYPDNDGGIIVEIVFFDYVSLKWQLYYAAFDVESDEMLFRTVVPFTQEEATKWFKTYREEKEVA
jgi:hypothetical protein